MTRTLTTLPSRCLYIFGLSASLCADALRAAFSRFGEVVEWSLGIKPDGHGGESKVTIYIEFASLADATAAFECGELHIEVDGKGITLPMQCRYVFVSSRMWLSASAIGSNTDRGGGEVGNYSNKDGLFEDLPEMGSLESAQTHRTYSPPLLHLEVDLNPESVAAGDFALRTLTVKCDVALLQR